MIKSGKLVRDNIPAIIRRDGKVPLIRTLDDDEAFLRAALDKVVEEATELRAAHGKDHTTTEMADLLEIIEEVRRLRRISRWSVYVERWRRARARGTFKKRVYLLGTT